MIRTGIVIGIAACVLTSGWLRVRAHGQETPVLAREVSRVDPAAASRTRLERLEAAAARVRARLPVDADVSGLIEQLSGTITATGASRPRWGLGAPSVEGPFERRPLSVTYTGTFASVHVLLAEIRRLDRVVNLDRVEVSRKEGTPPGEVEVSLRLYAFGLRGEHP